MWVEPCWDFITCYYGNKHFMSFRETWLLTPQGELLSSGNEGGTLFPLSHGPYSIDACRARVSHHYTDVIMTTMASQITSLTVVYSTVYSGADQRKHQSSASLAFVWGIHRDRWIPRTKGQLRGKRFHLMTSSCFHFIWLSQYQIRVYMRLFYHMNHKFH